MRKVCWMNSSFSFDCIYKQVCKPYRQFKVSNICFFEFEQLGCEENCWLEAENKKKIGFKMDLVNNSGFDYHHEWLTSCSRCHKRATVVWGRPCSSPEPLDPSCRLSGLSRGDFECARITNEGISSRRIAFTWNISSRLLAVNFLSRQNLQRYLGISVWLRMCKRKSTI